MKMFRSVHQANADKLHLQLHQNEGSVWLQIHISLQNILSLLYQMFTLFRKITPTLLYLFSILVTLPIQLLPFQINLKAQLPVSKRI